MTEQMDLEDDDLPLERFVTVSGELSLSHSHEIEIEHSLNYFMGLFVLVLLWAPLWWYDTEIRCALGSERACVSLQVKPGSSTVTKPITDRVPQ